MQEKVIVFIAFYLLDNLSKLFRSILEKIAGNAVPFQKVKGQSLQKSIPHYSSIFSKYLSRSNRI